MNRSNPDTIPTPPSVSINAIGDSHTVVIFDPKSFQITPTSNKRTPNGHDYGSYNNEDTDHDSMIALEYSDDDHEGGRGAHYYSDDDDDTSISSLGDDDHHVEDEADAIIPSTRRMLLIDELETGKPNVHGNNVSMNSRGIDEKQRVVTGNINNNYSNNSFKHSPTCQFINTDDDASSTKWNQNRRHRNGHLDTKPVACPCCKSYVHSVTFKKNNLLASHVDGRTTEETDDDNYDGNQYSTFSSYFTPSFWSRSTSGTAADDHSNLKQDYDHDYEPDDTSDVKFRTITRQRGNSLSEDTIGTTSISSNDARPRSLKKFRRGSRSSSPLSYTSQLSTQSSDFDYTIQRCVMETWLYKKGSGKDIFGSKSWKPRWCQLVLARVPSHYGDVDVPLLLVSWHVTMPKPSTIIVLDKKIAIAVNVKKKNNSPRSNGNKYAYRFDVASEEHGERLQANTRTFAASSEDEHLRNDWVNEINRVISVFDKTMTMLSRKYFGRLGRGTGAAALPPTVPRKRSLGGRQRSDASNLEGLDLVY